MNNVSLIGRLTKDPEVRNAGETMVAQFTLAVDRHVARKEGQITADFITCQAWGKRAEFMEKYFSKGMKLALTGRIQTGSYTNKDGQKVYTTDVVAENIEFVESKKDGSATTESAPQYDGFNVPDDDELPFVNPTR